MFELQIIFPTKPTWFPDKMSFFDHIIFLRNLKSIKLLSNINWFPI